MIAFWIQSLVAAMMPSGVGVFMLLIPVLSGARRNHNGGPNRRRSAPSFFAACAGEDTATELPAIRIKSGPFRNKAPDSAPWTHPVRSKTHAPAKLTQNLAPSIHEVRHRSGLRGVSFHAVCCDIRGLCCELREMTGLNPGGSGP